MRVTRDTLAVDTPVWVLGDSAYESIRTIHETLTIRNTLSKGSKTESWNTVRMLS